MTEATAAVVSAVPIVQTGLLVGIFYRLGSLSTTVAHNSDRAKSNADRIDEIRDVVEA